MTELEQQLMKQTRLTCAKSRTFRTGRQLNEQIQCMTKKLFGSSSEKTKVADGQISLFNPDNF